MSTLLLGAVVRLWRRISKGGVNRWERGRARSIAAASAPLHGEVLPAEEQQLVDAHHEILVEHRTAEHPIVARIRRRAVVRRPARWQRVAAARRAEHPARTFAADPLAAPLAGPLAPPVLCSSVRSSEPEAWRLESFTDCWTTAEIARIVDEVRAGAR